MASTNLTPGSGGTLTDNNGQVSLQFPPGAVSNDVTVSYTGLAGSTHPLAAGGFPLRALTLAVATATGQPVTQFNQPYILALSTSRRK